MRILVDIGERQLHALDELSRMGKRSRAAIIREAVTDFLERQQRRHSDEAFGLWNDHGIDGLALQEKIRGEW